MRRAAPTRPPSQRSDEGLDSLPPPRGSSHSLSHQTPDSVARRHTTEEQDRTHWTQILDKGEEAKRAQLFQPDVARRPTLDEQDEVQLAKERSRREPATPAGFNTDYDIYKGDDASRAPRVFQQQTAGPPILSEQDELKLAKARSSSHGASTGALLSASPGAPESTPSRADPPTPSRPAAQVRATTTATVGAFSVPGINASNRNNDTLDDTVVTERTSSIAQAYTVNEDPDEVLHDLGRAEPALPQDFKTSVMSWIQKHRCFTGLAVLLVVGAIVGGIVGAIFGRNSSGPVPTEAPSLSPTSAPTIPDFELVAETLSTLTPWSVLTDPTTPQAAAVRWLLEEDAYSVDFDNARKLLQRYALATIYFATNGTDWVRQYSFLSNQDECFWNERVDDRVMGVRECSDEGLVRRLVFRQNGLGGTLPNEIAGLVSLVEFETSASAGLQGSIPTSITLLTNLEEIFLYETNVSGTLPQDIGSLTALTTLSLFSNQIDGGIPMSLGRLTLLDILALYQNQLLGPLPSSIGNLSTLRHLLLLTNMLSGSIPSEVQRMTSLRQISLEMNDFTGGMENFCTESIAFTSLTADCLDIPALNKRAEVQCSCCTRCCAQSKTDACLNQDAGGGGTIPGI